jgi:molybdopterin molybdotransferase
MDSLNLKGLTVEDARGRMLAAVSRLTGETVALDQADGRVLAKTIVADRDQPPFDASAMDGWAVRGETSVGAAFRIVGESAAGRGHAGPLGQGEAVRIFTGAAVPAGADRVIIQEDAERDGERVRIAREPGAGGNIRPAGGDFRTGAVLLEAGERLDPWRLSLAAAAGRATVEVSASPRVALLATGEELAAPGGPASPFQIYESGSAGLVAMVRRWGGTPRRLAPAGDTVEAVQSAFAGVDADLIVTVGGASVGDYDVVKPALARLGLRLLVETVNVRPGKPTWFGVLDDGRQVLGLPGNPASAFVCAELFLAPLLAAMQGAAAGPILERGTLAQALGPTGPREHWMRALLSDEGVVPLPDQDSSLVSVFASAQALLRRPGGGPALAAGDPVEFLRLARG